MFFDTIQDAKCIEILHIGALEVIYKASAGNKTAIREILKFYEAYICKLCLRPFYHSESGKIIMQIDEELKGQIHTEMIKAILKFEIRVK